MVGAELFSFNNVFLGDLVPASRSMDSVCDTTGQYGSGSSSTSIRNPFGAYGNPDGPASAFSLYAVNPPVVMLDGERLGALTVSPFILDAINPFELLKELECS